MGEPFVDETVQVVHKLKSYTYHEAVLDSSKLFAIEVRLKASKFFVFIYIFFGSSVASTIPHATDGCFGEASSQLPHRWLWLQDVLQML